MSEQVVLVDESDAELGTAGKAEVHRGRGELHRAVSVFLFDGDGRLLLQRRAATKYHFAGLWANTCCSHPRPGEGVVAAGERRLREEMGISARLRHAGSFVYRAVDPRSGLVEHEFDYVLVGSFSGTPLPDPAETDDWAWIEMPELKRRLASGDGGYVPWLSPALAAMPAPGPDVPEET